MKKKEVQILRSNKNLKYIVYNLLKNGVMPKDICSKLNMHMSALSYHLRLLKESGSIRKIGYGVWETIIYQEKEVKKVQVGDLKTSKNLNFSTKDNRGHAFRFKIKIPKLNNWEKREQFLKKNNISYEIINRGYTHRIILKGCKIWLNSSSIVVYFPPGLSFFGKSAKDSEDRAVFEMLIMMKSLDNLFHTSFKINKKYHIRVFGKHHSHVKNGLARMYNDEGRRIAIFNEDGQWLLIDDSFNLDELETVGNKGKNDSTKDMDGVIRPFFNSLKEKPFTAYDFENMFTLTNKAVKNQDRYAENIELHLKAIQEIRDTLKEIKEIAKK